LFVNNWLKHHRELAEWALALTLKTRAFVKKSNRRANAAPRAGVKSKSRRKALVYKTLRRPAEPLYSADCGRVIRRRNCHFDKLGGGAWTGLCQFDRPMPRHRIRRSGSDPKWPQAVANIVVNAGSRRHLLGEGPGDTGACRRFLPASR